MRLYSRLLGELPSSYFLRDWKKKNLISVWAWMGHSTLNAVPVWEERMGQGVIPLTGNKCPSCKLNYLGTIKSMSVFLL